ncbi:hypothetical protein QTO34_006314 [Cnephaeus nilssonii]|uniref:Coiled-coil SMC6 And NSE5 INteracting (CANIN) domain-containing protein n=1 Tax=Cnephaeus nilssonii TaxID=3371016 RepID=A0AA40HKB1_CNENI|nr:hypothetical protein QTO34_006314 [Eptesicus nilssonii]
MARSQKTVPALPQTEGVQAAAAIPILLPNLKHSGFDHPLRQGVCQPTQRLCSPNSAPAPNLSKKPKMQATGDMLPADWSPPRVTVLTSRATRDVVPTHWSPPHVTFLTPWAPKAGRGALARRCVGTVGPEGLRRLACSVPVELEQEPQASGPVEDLASREEQLWSTAGPSQQAAAGTGTGLTAEGSESYVNSSDYLLQEKREQALEPEPGELLLQDPADHDSLDLHEEAVSSHTRAQVAGGRHGKKGGYREGHRTLVERCSVSLEVIPSVHPGEAVFLPRHRPLPCDLDSSHLEPHNHLERLFLTSPRAQQLSFLRSGLLSNLYLHRPGCPAPLLRWLFQLLAWPPEISSGAFGLLWDLSVDGLFRPSGQYQGVGSPFHSSQSPAPAAGEVPGGAGGTLCHQAVETGPSLALASAFIES